LKHVLNIPLGEDSDWQIQNFFMERFKKDQAPEFSDNVEDEPDLEMLSRQVFGHLQEVGEKKEEISKEAKVIKEQMLGYVNAIVKRQDRYDILKKVETF